MNLPKNLPAVSITPAVADDDGSLSGLMATLPVAGFEARLLFSTHRAAASLFRCAIRFFYALNLNWRYRAQIGSCHRINGGI